MIILDEEDHQVKFDAIVAGSTVRYPDKVVGRSSTSLPDYEASEAQHRLIIGDPQSLPKKTRRNTRILKATFYALAVYVALSAVIVLPLVLTRKNSQPRGYSRGPNSANMWTDGNAILEPQTSFIDAAIIPFFSSSNADCSEWQKLVNSAPTLQASYLANFPSTSPISIRSNISSVDHQVTNGVAGSLNVGINPDDKATEVVVLLQANASDYGVLQQTNICVYQQDDRGLIIYAPGDLSDLQYIYFSIQLLFPSKSSRYIVPTFAINLPQFTQHFAHLSKHLSFKTVSIIGSMYEIVCQSMQAPVIGIRNIRSSISGTFNVSNSLTLDTIDAPITSNITLTSYEAQAPRLVLDTGNSPINAAISLSSGTNSNSGAPISFFTSCVKTFSAPINLSIATEGLPLRLYAVTNSAPTNITLDSSFEGEFDLQTKLAPVSVNDPSSTAVSYVLQSHERITGRIGSPPSPPSSTSRTGSCGQVVVVSALGPISLNIVP